MHEQGGAADRERVSAHGVEGFKYTDQGLGCRGVTEKRTSWPDTERLCDGAVGFGTWKLSKG